HRASERRQVEAPVRPVTGLPDALVIAAVHAGIMGFILRIRKLFTAYNAAIEVRFPATRAALPRHGRDQGGAGPGSIPVTGASNHPPRPSCSVCWPTCPHTAPD